MYYILRNNKQLKYAVTNAFRRFKFSDNEFLLWVFISERLWNKCANEVTTLTTSEGTRDKKARYGRRTRIDFYRTLNPSRLPLSNSAFARGLLSVLFSRTLSSQFRMFSQSNEIVFRIASSVFSCAYILPAIKLRRRIKGTLRTCMNLSSENLRNGNWNDKTKIR